MQFYKKYSIQIAILFLGLLFFFTRFYNILLLPIFTDESIYIFWAKRIATEHAYWLISLSDGKPPLLIWMIASLLTVLPNDLYLLAGRLPSIFAGFVTLIGIYTVTNFLFKSNQAAFIAGFLYILTPFTLFYDRMALFDSLLSAMLIWTVYFSLRTSQTLKVKDACMWGFILGLGFLSKPPAILFLVLTPVSFLLFTPKTILKKQWKKIALLLLLVIGISEGINNMQRVSGAYPLMALKNQQFQQPLNQLIDHPFQLLHGNSIGFFSWVTAYYTVPFLVVGSICFLFLLLKKRKEGVFLMLLWLFPIFIFASIGREIFPRYIVFTTPYFLIPLAYVFDLGLKQKLLLRITTLIVFVAIIIQPLQFDVLLLTYPPAAPLPLTDYNQYISQHPSGYGLSKIFAFLHEESKKGKVTLVTQGTFGLYPYAFNLEYWDNKNVQIIDRWPLAVIDQDIIDAQKTSKVYILFKEHATVPENLPVKLVLKGEKPGGQYPILLTTFK